MDEGAVFFALNNLLDNLLDKLRDLLGDTLLFDTIKPDKKITEVALARRLEIICTPQRQAGRGQEAAGCSSSSLGAVARGRYGRGEADAISWPAAKGMGDLLVRRALLDDRDAAVERSMQTDRDEVAFAGCALTRHGAPEKQDARSRPGGVGCDTRFR